mgnify:CR=1 FL=1
MPESMTGFSAAHVTTCGLDVRVEMRSVNHRHLDLRFKLPPTLTALHGELNALVRAQIDRGHIDVIVVIGRDEQATPDVRVDLPLARAWHRALTEVAAGLSLPDGPDLALIVGQPGVLVVSRPETELAHVQPAVVDAVQQATAALVANRAQEGAALTEDLVTRLASLRTLLAQLEGLAATIVTVQRERLHDRVTRALAETGHDLDPGRLAQEVVMLSDKSDITEELVRLRGHLEATDTLLTQARPGKKLGFLAQEILREFNTIGSKSGALAITERVVSAKVELEKVREQVLNLA